MEKKLYKDQISTLNLIKNYLRKTKKKDVNVDISPITDFVTWSNGLGLQKLLLLESKKLINKDYLKIFFKELISVGKNYDYKLISPKTLSKKKINVIYSYCKKEDFKKNYYSDLYFNERSNNFKDTYWFLISLDGYVPKNKLKNVFILYNNKEKFNLFYLIKYIFNTIKFKNSFFYLNNTTNTSKIFSRFFYQTFKKNKLDLYLPYENRPHQNLIIKIVKKISKKNKTFGYFHRLPEPLQTEMFYKIKELDYLLINSQIQKNIFKKFFMWPEFKLKIIKSFRHHNIKLRKNIIYLPFEIKNTNFYLRKLNYINNNFIFLNKNFNISLHPLKSKNNEHISLKKKINKMIDKNKFKNINNISIILGAPGSVASECLQTFGKVLHITSSKFDIFSSAIWENIKVKKITNDIYLYERKSTANFINTDKKKNNLKYFLKIVNRGLFTV